MKEKDFKTLERLNAQIDVWIDEEQYGYIWGEEKASLGVSMLKVGESTLASQVDACFENPNCTHDKDDSGIVFLAEGTRTNHRHR